MATHQSIPLRVLGPRFAARIARANDSSEWERRLLDRAVRSQEGCWLFTGCLSSEGYGKIGVMAASELAHRLSYRLFCGSIPDGLFVCHKCDVPNCVRPDHLFLGTNLDNVRDMVAKGRNQKGDQHIYRRRPDLRPRGEAIGTAKVTEEIVREICRRAGAGERQIDLADEFGVSRSAVCMMVGRQTWRHLWE